VSVGVFVGVRFRVRIQSIDKFGTLHPEKNTTRWGPFWRTCVWMILPSFSRIARVAGVGMFAVSAFRLFVFGALLSLCRYSVFPTMCWTWC
jgi:hypothetical protein